MIPLSRPMLIAGAVISRCDLPTTTGSLTECGETPKQFYLWLPINIISAADQLVIICLILLASHSQTSSDSINYFRNGNVIMDAVHLDSYLIP